MNERIFTPDRKYLLKQWLLWTLLALAIVLGSALLAIPVGMEEGAGAGLILISVVFGLALLFWLGAVFLAAPYYRSLRYEIHEDEVIVHVGILTKSVKHVPFRTVTNITVKRDILDRWFFGLGSLTIQTAGMSGQTGAEESLVGLTNVQEVYELVARELRRFRSGMAPTGADVDSPQIENEEMTLAAILTEVRAIGEGMKKQ